MPPEAWTLAIKVAEGPAIGMAIGGGLIAFALWLFSRPVAQLAKTSMTIPEKMDQMILKMSDMAGEMSDMANEMSHIKTSISSLEKRVERAERHRA